jgi:hypothetical protein
MTGALTYTLHATVPSARRWIGNQIIVSRCVMRGTLEKSARRVSFNVSRKMMSRSE